MTSYTDIFTGNPVQTSPTNYRAFTFGSSLTLSWPITNEDTANTTADIMEVTASAASLNLIMPAANEVSNGKSCIIKNVGSNTFTVTDSSSNTIATISAGTVWWIYVKNNSSAVGSWGTFQYGATTSIVQAATLAGAGIYAAASALNLYFPVTTYNANHTMSVGDRATTLAWTGGAGTFSFPASSTLTNGWFVLIKNAGSGSLTLSATDTIDGAASVALSAGQSCFVDCSGSALYTIGLPSLTAAPFTRLVKSVAGNTDVTLSAGEAVYDIQEYTGVLTGNINVIVPTAVARWWIYNATSGAYTLTVKTVAGTGIAITQGTRRIMHCDGTNVVLSNDSGSGTVTSVATGTGLSGGPITTTGTISLANTAVAAGTYGDASNYPTFVVDAQGRLTSASTQAIGATAPFADNVALIKNSSDTTKKAIFSAAGLSTGVTRTYTLPDVAGDTLALLAATQTLTNKTIVGGSNTISGITETMLSTSDITTLNVSSTKHGFAPKNPNDATQYLDGTGAYSVPAGTPSLPSATITALSGTNVVITVDFTTYAAYSISIQGLSVSGGGGGNLVVAVSSDGGGSYATSTIITKNISNTTVSAVSAAQANPTSGAAILQLSGILSQGSTSGTAGLTHVGGDNNLDSFYGSAVYSTSAAINRVKISISANNFDAGYVIIAPIAKR